MGLARFVADVLRTAAELGTALGANLAVAAAQTGQGELAMACIGATALLIVCKNADHADVENADQQRIEARLRELLTAQHDLQHAIELTASAPATRESVSEQRVLALQSVLSADADALAGLIDANKDLAEGLERAGAWLTAWCAQHQRTLDDFRRQFDAFAAKTDDDHARMESKVDTLIERVTPPPLDRLHQLRPPVPDFTGRQGDLDELLDQIRAGGIAITGVQGLGGIGKTELAYALADRLKDGYPDAQLYLDLKGTSPQPLTAADALTFIIRSFHPDEKLPEDVAPLQGRYNSALHGKRVLLLMDNASDAPQVAPLCPPPAGSVLLVTSRQHFTLPGVYVKNLDTLPLDESCKLLRTICPRLADVASPPCLPFTSRSEVKGGRRSKGEFPPGTDPAEQIARLCGCLPLALRVAASALAERATLTPADYIKRLQARGLKELDAVAASLTLSDDLLPDDLRQRWHMLAVFPGHFDVAAPAAVWKAEHDDAQDALDALHRYSVLEWNNETRRFRLHDLVRSFLRDRLSHAPPPNDELTAVRRFVEHYTAYACEADELLGQKDKYTVGLVLFDAEWPNIQAAFAEAQGLAAEQTWASEVLVELACGCAYCLDLRLHGEAKVRWLTAGLEGARRLKNRQAEGAILSNVGTAYAEVGDARKAIEFHEQSLSISREVRDRHGEAHALGNLGIDHALLGDPRRTIQFQEQALAISREIRDQRAEANEVGNLGSAHATLGAWPTAAEYYEQLRSIARILGDRRAEAGALCGLGVTCAMLGDVRKAIEFYEQALVIDREIGDRHGEADALGNLGNAHLVLDDAPKAIEFYEQCLILHREIGDRRGEGNGLGNLGNAYAALGDPRRGIDFCEQALTIMREIRDRAGEGMVSWIMGLAYERLGDLARAAELMQLRVDFEHEIGHPDADKHAAEAAALRARLK